MAANAPDFAALLGSIERCAASYESDEGKSHLRFTAMGCTVLGRLSTDDCQGLAIVAPDGVNELVITGTRFFHGRAFSRITDLAEDVDFFPHMLDGDAAVSAGAFRRISRLWSWSAPLFAGRKLRITGHSLGGQAAHAAMSVIPLEQISGIIAWEPPKAGNKAFWERYKHMLDRVTTVVHGSDPFFAWPPSLGVLCHPPVPTLWLKTTAEWSVLASPMDWPGGKFEHHADHTASSLIATVQALLDRGLELTLSTSKTKNIP